jgi:hypothetical protein
MGRDNGYMYPQTTRPRHSSVSKLVFFKRKLLVVSLDLLLLFIDNIMKKLRVEQLMEIIRE